MNETYGRYTFSLRKWSVLKRIEELGGSIQYVSRHCGIVSAVVPREQMKGILEDPGLLTAEVDYPVLLPKPMVVGVITREGMRRSVQSSGQVVTWNVSRVWKGTPNPYAGAGVRVGVVDTGIDLNHPDLHRNIKGGVNIVEPKRPPQDGNGHGTHVAGIIAAHSNKQGVIGVAPSASLYAIKVLNDRGVGSITTLVQGIDWGIDNRMHILNLSLSGGRKVPAALTRAIQIANRRGVLVVAAAGNSGNAAGTGDTVEIPARLQPVVAVAALTRGNKRAPFSATGPSLDIAAPGVNILSTYKSGRYGILNGTSQAAPHVSGVAAVYRQQGLSTGTIRQVLGQRAISLGSRRLYGAGLLQL
ncbi:S8 family peptidase [Desmospora profundinema]|uniref:Subtilisin family serine protease n=1 Tax=Desmospora profundinema TaxID=1571184 RepID=A0ABU1IKI3_9BACL|nr:S8 family peptidase [Desmospora profundinema]MDR6225286.1 subtilisin family serine protease [Desmospora profundinema]